MNPVKIVPFKSTGEFITVSKTNPENGAVRLEWTPESGLGRFYTEKKPLSMLMNGKVEGLKNLLKNNPKKEFPGKLVIIEVTENEADELLDIYGNKNLTGEEKLAPFIKKASSDADAPELTLGGYRILKFVDYDPTGKVDDITLKHENTAETKAYYHAKKDAEATLPGTKAGK